MTGLLGIVVCAWALATLICCVVAFIETIGSNKEVER